LTTSSEWVDASANAPGLWGSSFVQQFPILPHGNLQDNQVIGSPLSQSFAAYYVYDAFALLLMLLLLLLLSCCLLLLSRREEKSTHSSLR
jgi:hypothetical protein